MAERNVSKLLNDGKSFFVPFYQRGYRWTDEEIEQLLDDISEWQSDQGYFLQLLVVCWNNEENRYNIVDGQQRLTTISLILENLGENGCNITYARGEKGAADERFRANARRIISEWLSKSDVDKDLLKKNILNAAFLYHEVPPEEEEAMFQQLNTWRIPATDAELVKCIVLSKGEPEVISCRAYEWDLVERSLQDNSFWGMLGIDEKKHPSRMEAFLQKLFSRTQDSSQKFPIFETVKTKDKNGIADWWQSFLKEWQANQTDYGEILRFNYTGWKNNRRGREMMRFYRDSAQLSADLYNDDPDYVRNYLLLANAAYSWMKGERYDFYRHRRDRAISIEHIHARNQHKLSEDDLKKILPDKVKNEHWDEIWEPYSCEPDVVKAEDLLAKYLLDHKIRYPENSVDNSIGNLALLTESENSSFGNGTFSEKRVRMNDSIIKGDVFFPSLTQAVFHRTLPCLTDNSYWSPPDRHAYRQFVSEAIYRFLEAARFAGIYDPEVVVEVLP